MKITLPFEYRLTGIEPYKRNPSGRTCYDNVAISAPDVAEEDFHHALTLTDSEGRHLETFYHHDGSFWIADTRNQPFLEQHLMLAGHYPRKPLAPLPPHATAREHANYRRFTQEDADRWNTGAAEGLRRIGLLSYASVKPSIDDIVPEKGELAHPFVERDGEIVCETVRLDWEFRSIQSDGRDVAREKAVALAERSVVAFRGAMYHRVSEPIVYATGTKVDWKFSRILPDVRTPYNSADTCDTSSDDAYRVPMADERAIKEAFPELYAKDMVQFRVHFIDENFFEKIDYREGVVKDIKALLGDRFRLASKPTAFIAKWCEVRDLVEHVERQLDRPGCLPDSLFDDVSAVLTEMEAAGMGKYPGATLWNSREIALGIENPSDSRDVSCGR